jgi:hypothetical protein
MFGVGFLNAWSLKHERKSVFHETRNKQERKLRKGKKEI